jgi:hypothetical protein
LGLRCLPAKPLSTLDSLNSEVILAESSGALTVGFPKIPTWTEEKLITSSVVETYHPGEYGAKQRNVNYQTKGYGLKTKRC